LQIKKIPGFTDRGTQHRYNQHALPRIVKRGETDAIEGIGEYAAQKKTAESLPAQKYPDILFGSDMKRSSKKHWCQ